MEGDRAYSLHLHYKVNKKTCECQLWCVVFQLNTNQFSLEQYKEALEREP
jgi:hypothetical protein